MKVLRTGRLIGAFLLSAILALPAAAQVTDRLNGVQTGLAIKAPVKAVAVSNITLSGEQTVNGIAVVDGDRVLVTAQTSSVNNGIYVVDTSAWERAADFDGNRDVAQGTLVVLYNATADGVLYQVTSADPIVIDTSAITFQLQDDPAITYPQTAGEISAGVTVVNGSIPPGNALRYGTNTTPGTTNMATAIQAAIDVAEAGGRAYVPAGTYLITSQLTIADGTPITLYGDGNQTIIKKGFNGAMLSLGLKSELTQIYLDGNGANFTGRGVIIETGGGQDGWQNIHDATILDTQSYAIELTGSGDGWASRIVNNRLGTYLRATFAIKFPDTDNNGPRLVANNVTVGPLVDLGGTLGSVVSGNIGGESLDMTIPGIQMNDDSNHAAIVGNSFDSNSAIFIVGDEHTFIGNIVRGGYSFEAGATNSFAAGNIGDAYVNLDIDNSGTTSNYIYGTHHEYTPTWDGLVSDPVLGNGTLAAKYQQIGRRVHLQINVTMGSTTTYGSGLYNFTLPPSVKSPGNGASYGTCRMSDSSAGTIRVGIATINGSTVFCETDSTSGVTATSPFTFADGDELDIDILYNY